MENNYLGEAAVRAAEAKCGSDLQCQQHVINEVINGHNDKLQEGAAAIADLALDFTPVVGDAKAFAEAENRIDYAIAAVGLIPGVGDAVGKVLKEAKVALKAGDGSSANRLVKEAQETAYFGQQRKFWSAEPVQFNGNKVYQRNDLFDPKHVDSKTGKSNLELMRSGRAPIGTDGKPVNLHHMTQKQEGTIAEVTQSFHKDNHGIIHVNDNSIPSGINRAEFNKWRANYWKSRVNDFN